MSWAGCPTSGQRSNQEPGKLGGLGVRAVRNRQPKDDQGHHAVSWGGRGKGWAMPPVQGTATQLPSVHRGARSKLQLQGDLLLTSGHLVLRPSPRHAWSLCLTQLHSPLRPECQHLWPTLLPHSPAQCPCPGKPSQIAWVASVLCAWDSSCHWRAQRCLCLRSLHASRTRIFTLSGSPKVSGE